jgi:hypothetical protein
MTFHHGLCRDLPVELDIRRVRHLSSISQLPCWPPDYDLAPDPTSLGTWRAHRRIGQFLIVHQRFCALDRPNLANALSNIRCSGSWAFIVRRYPDGSGPQVLAMPWARHSSLGIVLANSAKSTALRGWDQCVEIRPGSAGSTKTGAVRWEWTGCRNAVHPN